MLTHLDTQRPTTGGHSLKHPDLYKPFPGGMLEITVTLNVPALPTVKDIPPWQIVQTNQLYFGLKRVIAWLEDPESESLPWRDILSISTRFTELADPKV